MLYNFYYTSSISFCDVKTKILLVVPQLGEKPKVYFENLIIYGGVFFLDTEI